EGALAPGWTLVVLVTVVAVIGFIVFMERAQRRLLIQYPKRQVGNRMFEGQASHLPLKLNTSGVIPPIFASSLLLLPTTVANFNAGQGPDWFVAITTQLGHGRPLFLVLYIGLIVFFAFFYTAIVFNPTETADNLKKHGGFIPGIRPGERTAEYIDYVLSRITVIGAAYLALVCLLPEILISYAAVPFYFGGTSLLIVVSVTMDTVAQIQGYLLAHQYEGLIKRSKLRGRRRWGWCCSARRGPAKARRRSGSSPSMVWCSFRPVRCCVPRPRPARRSACAPRKRWRAADSCPTRRGGRSSPRASKGPKRAGASFSMVSRARCRRRMRSTACSGRRASSSTPSSSSRWTSAPCSNASRSGSPRRKRGARCCAMTTIRRCCIVVCWPTAIRPRRLPPITSFRACCARSMAWLRSRRWEAPSIRCFARRPARSRR